MPKEKTQETSESILDQIKGAELETSDTEEETEDQLTFKGIEESEEETEELETDEETSDQEETKAAEEKEEAKPELFPIVVNGQTEYVTKEKLIEFAQKGRYLEQERAKDKGEKPAFDAEKADKEFMADVKKYGFVGAMGRLMMQGYEGIQGQESERRKAGRHIADSSEWGKEAEYRSLFNMLLDERMDPETAGIKVSAKYWEEKAKKAEEIGEKKAERKESVKMVKGKEVAPDAREAKGEASVMQQFEQAFAEGKPTSELLKIMRRGGVQVGRDTI